jgi:hypothetical protein
MQHQANPQTSTVFTPKEYLLSHIESVVGVFVKSFLVIDIRSESILWKPYEIEGGG